jgi:hypothetical protein
LAATSFGLSDAIVFPAPLVSSRRLKWSRAVASDVNGNDQARVSIMSIIFDMLYREYCRARLAEMRKQLLISVASDGILQAPPVDCDFCDPDDKGSSLVRKEPPTIG